jgi:anthranilate phosphoribosyltransferase
MASDSPQGKVSISDLLKRLSTVESTRNVKAEEVAAALALVFNNALSPVQFGLLLWALHVTEGDHHPKVLTACAKVMRDAAAQVDGPALIDVVKRKGRPEGAYYGGLVWYAPNLLPGWLKQGRLIDVLISVI